MKKINQQQLDQFINQIWNDFLQQASSESLYQSLISSNWDSNKQLLDWILNHEEVDQAVVLIAYWMSGPTWAKQFKDQQDVLVKQSWYLESFNFIEQLEAKYLAGFWKNNHLFYDPANDHNGYNWVSEYSDVAIVRDIPEMMKYALNGKVLDISEAYEDGLPDPWLSRIWNLFDEYEIEE